MSEESSFSIAEKQTLRAFQRILSTWTFIEPQSFQEKFSQERFKKKLIPFYNAEKKRELSAILMEECWSNWKAFDENLAPIEYLQLDSAWFSVRCLLHKWFRNFKPDMCRIGFPKGSEFIPTGGANSIAARLEQSEWTVTEDCFLLFASVVYKHNGLKKAFRKRFLGKWFIANHDGFVNVNKAVFHEYNKRLWTRTVLNVLETEFVDVSSFAKALHSVPFECFAAKLRTIVTIVEGNRFWSVPKNKDKNRPIAIEPLGNIIVQRTIGNSLRYFIKVLFGVDLDTAATEHRKRILSGEIATIDLSNASDSLSCELVKFLFPRELSRYLFASRSPKTNYSSVYKNVVGPQVDNHWYECKKISSMGNGFTFELMTLVILTLTRCIDSSSLVFGDDIICKKEYAARIIGALEQVNFVINTDKTFVQGDFYESCGANVYKGAYIESYDFHYPETIIDCVITWNKVFRLSAQYESFQKLKNTLGRAIPIPLRGGYDTSFCDKEYKLLQTYLSETDNGLSLDFPAYFTWSPTSGVHQVHPLVKWYFQKKLFVQLGKAFPCYRYTETLRTPTRDTLYLSGPLSLGDWAKYLMYLASGRKTNDVMSIRKDERGIVRFRSVQAGPYVIRYPNPRVLASSLIEI